MELDYVAQDSVALLLSPQYCRICRGHESRLRLWIKSREIPIDEALACELCKVTYRVVLRRRVVWDRSHACGWRACLYLTQVFIILSILSILCYIMLRLFHSIANDSATEMIPVVILFALTSFVSFTAVYKVTRRWYYTTSITFIDTIDK
ncbi:hypothetical protein THRCLA_20313 [Thraustotheca clavata]|uniref:RING-CH-type domain-containing protein n=1 Tax=Thraustotheca clavata TaxID=74557 RepID=A0A1W0A8R3_9STRA|nr:hypothetical protein THRCLA_20313 [Thraustotheca clavata]